MFNREFGKSCAEGNLDALRRMVRADLKTAEEELDEGSNRACMAALLDAVANLANVYDCAAYIHGLEEGE